MKAKILVAASLLAVAPALTNVASAAPQSHGSLSFTDYTPDPTMVVATETLHVATGMKDPAYCHGGRVPSAPQDITSHQLKVPAASMLRMTATTSGAWGFEVDDSRGKTLLGAATVGAGPTTGLQLRVRPGTYVISACNLGGAPTAQVSYKLAR